MPPRKAPNSHWRCPASHESPGVRHSIEICKKTIHSSDKAKDPIWSSNLAQTRRHTKLHSNISGEKPHHSATPRNENDHGMFQDNINGGTATRNRPPPNRFRTTQTDHKISGSCANATIKTPNEILTPKRSAEATKDVERYIHIKPRTPG